jgi:hypothetical protein
MEVFILSSPYTYQIQNYLNYFNVQPSDVKGRSNLSVEHYKRELYNMIYSVFEFDLPKDWALNFFRFFLFHCGSISVIYTKEYGWVCQPYSFTELDLYYNPKMILVDNQFFKSPKYGMIGVNAGIIKIFDDYFGLDSLVTRYAEKLAQCDKSIDINLMNANVALVAEVKNKKQADTIKEAYGKATSGEPLVAIGEDTLNGKSLNTLIANVKNTFIANDIQVLKRSIVNEFLTRVGIRNTNYEKKERLTTSEVNENNDETKALISIIYDNIKSCMDEINIFSGLGLGVRFRYEYAAEEGGEENANDVIRDDGSESESS